MDAQQPVLGPANTRWNDCVGTVAADDAEALRDRPSLYDLAQIDRDRYTIVGIELNVDRSTTATVYAIDRIEHAISRQDEIVELGRSRGEISRGTLRHPRTACRRLHRARLQEDLHSDGDTGSTRPGSCHRLAFGRGPGGIGDRASIRDAWPPGCARFRHLRQTHPVTKFVAASGMSSVIQDVLNERCPRPSTESAKAADLRTESTQEELSR